MKLLNNASATKEPKKHGLGLRSKFLFVLLGSTIACILITAYQSLSLSQGALDHSLHQHLTSLRSSRIDQVQTYFREKRAQMSVFSKTPSVIEAMKEFSAATSLLAHYEIAPSPEELDKLEAHYKTSLLPQLEEMTGNIRIANQFVPEANLGRYLQYHYIVNNPAPVGHKQLYDFADDGSFYSELHQKHHKNMLSITEGFSFYDLFLIDPKKAHIAYSVYKELDFSTSLNKGPYSNSNLANIVRKVIEHPVKGDVLISDFAAYEPSLGQAAAFLATPLYDGAEFIGVLAAQIPVSELNSILTNDENWVRDGLGETGEVYLVGYDRLMRSNSRFSHQSTLPKIEKTDKIPNEKVPESASSGDTKDVETSETASTSSKANSSILQQQIDNEAITDAIRGNTGIKTVDGYKGYSMLTAYAPLNVPGLDWVMVAEKGYDEAHDPITTIEKALLTGASVTAAIMTLYALFVSNVFVGPVQSILTHVGKVISGEEAEPLESKRKDEFGLLTHDINAITAQLNSQQALNQKQTKLLKERLLMVLPHSIADRFDSGESQIVDKFPNIAVVVIHFSGLNEATSGLEAQEAFKTLKQIIISFDDAAQSHGVDRITTQGNLYIAASGLMNPRLDYARNAITFAEEVLTSIQRFNIAHGHSIYAQIGISSGDVIAGVIGKQKPIYNLMGETVTTANVLAENATNNSIKINAPVYNQLLDTEDFSPCPIITQPFIGEIANWENIIHPKTQDEQA